MGIVSGLNSAFEGLVYIIRRERNARIHLLAALGVLALSLYLNLSLFASVSLLFAVILVFLAEITNSAIEKTLDLVNPTTDRRVAVIKDMAAAGVLVCSIGAIAIAALVFVPLIAKL